MREDIFDNNITPYFVEIANNEYLASSDDIKREICNAIIENSKSMTVKAAAEAIGKDSDGNSLKTNQGSICHQKMTVKAFNAGIDKFDIKGRKR